MEHKWEVEKFKKVSIYECARCGSMLFLKPDEPVPHFKCIPVEIRTVQKKRI